MLFVPTEKLKECDIEKNALCFNINFDFRTFVHHSVFADLQNQSFGRPGDILFTYLKNKIKKKCRTFQDKMSATNLLIGK